MYMGKLSDNTRIIKNGRVSGLDRMFKSSDFAFYHITDRLNLLRKSVEFGIPFLARRLAYALHASMIKSIVYFFC